MFAFGVASCDGHSIDSCDGRHRLRRLDDHCAAEQAVAGVFPIDEGLGDRWNAGAGGVPTMRGIELSLNGAGR
ncbi:hypothetical protein ACIBF7_25125 [Nonomuraea sp. NPDC050478]|uniref:hypothetical protein n=1 Tax=Nonomuraea sp. NPDC050478 TaxID=3364365 RepID=UPI00378D6550